MNVCFVSVPVLAQSTIRWCTTSNAENKKCEAMSQALAAASIRPSVSCVSGSTVQGCFQKLQVGFGFEFNVMLEELRTHLRLMKYFSWENIIQYMAQLSLIRRRCWDLRPTLWEEIVLLSDSKLVIKKFSADSK